MLTVPKELISQKDVEKSLEVKTEEKVEVATKSRKKEDIDDEETEILSKNPLHWWNKIMAEEEWHEKLVPDMPRIGKSNIDRTLK